MKKIVAMMMVLALCMGCALADMKMNVSFMAQGVEGELVDFIECDPDGSGVKIGYAVVQNVDDELCDLYYFDGETPDKIMSDFNYVGMSVVREKPLHHLDHLELEVQNVPDYTERLCIFGSLDFIPWISEIEATGDVKMREMPNKEAKILDYLEKGEHAGYLYTISTDERGVDWYKIEFDGQQGWVSSRYSETVWED